MGLQLLVLAPQEATHIALMHKLKILSSLVGGFNPFEKYACQIGSFPELGVKIKKQKPTPS